MKLNEISVGVQESPEGTFLTLVRCRVNLNEKLPPLDGTPASFTRREKARSAIEKRIEEAIRSVEVK